MTTKKATAARSERASNVTTDEDSERHVKQGQFLAAILARPEVSDATKNTVAEVINEMADKAQAHLDDPEVIALTFPVSARRLPPDYLEGARVALLTSLGHGDDAEIVEQIRAQVFEVGGRAHAGPEDSEADDAELVFRTMTHREARVIAERLMRDEMDDGQIGDVLALLCGLAYCDPSERESILYATMPAFMKQSPTAHRSMERLAVDRFRGTKSEVESFTTKS